MKSHVRVLIIGGGVTGTGIARDLALRGIKSVVLEKSQFIDKDRLQKYLKGRQHLGSADNLPVLSNQEPEGEFNGQQSSADTGLIYRALVEMRTDISDLKKMLAKFLYSTFSEKEIKALPSAMKRDIDPNDISSHIRDQMDDSSLGIRSVDATLEEEETEEIDEVEQFFTDKEIPSIEEAERFLIEQALKRFDGNRRKASEALGVSERTLYRKLDQYGLE